MIHSDLNLFLGAMQRSQLAKVPFQKQLIGSLALIVLGFNFTKRFYTFPHAHKDESKPMLLLNGELHPFEHQPEVIVFLFLFTNADIGRVRQAQTIHASQSLQLKRNVVVKLKL